MKALDLKSIVRSEKNAFWLDTIIVIPIILTLSEISTRIHIVCTRKRVLATDLDATVQRGKNSNTVALRFNFTDKDECVDWV